VTGMQDIVTEIHARLGLMREQARDSGTNTLVPLLILGTTERVGSTWVSDTLRPVVDQHNEPFRQQFGAGHPWSALNPRLADPPAGTDGLGRQCLVSFAVAKYGPHRQMVKETNLFFALPAPLPGASVPALSRCPLGVASSFVCGVLSRHPAVWSSVNLLTSSGDYYDVFN
jgi:hypothetical protein